MRIGLLERENDPELRSFLDRLGSSSSGAVVLGYHYPEYRDILVQTLQPGTTAQYLGAWDASGTLCGVLPGMLKHSEEYSCYNSLPFFGPNAGVLASYDEDGFDDIQQRLLAAALDLARHKGALTATFYGRFAPELKKMVPMNFPRGTVVQRVRKFTQYLVLPNASPVHWPSSRRRNIRKAKAAGVEVTHGIEAAHIDQMLDIYAQNCQDYGIPQKPASAVRQIVNELQGRPTTYGAYLAGELIAALVVFWGPRTASYYLPCSDSAYRTLQPGTLLVDAACTDAIERGVCYLNFESSPNRDSGVYQFKKTWGSIEREYEIAVARFCPLDQLQALGPERLSQLFPFFFVYPYTHLTSTAA